MAESWEFASVAKTAGNSVDALVAQLAARTAVLKVDSTAVDLAEWWVSVTVDLWAVWMDWWKAGHWDARSVGLWVAQMVARMVGMRVRLKAGH